MNFKRAFIILMVLMLLPGLALAQETVRFNVQKFWANGDGTPTHPTTSVDVKIVCNSGVPLEQEATITSSVGVEFVVTEMILDSADIGCTIMEMPVPNGFTVLYDTGAPPFSEISCSYVGGEKGNLSTDNKCEITNQVAPTSFTVTTDWTVNEETGDEVDQVVGITIKCNAEMTPGSEIGNTGFWTYFDTLFGDDYVKVMVDTGRIGTYCEASDDMQDSAVETTSECSGLYDLGPASPNGCGFVYTVFFEGIPTLSQYGLAIMALLMLGVGFVGFRRFV